MRAILLEIYLKTAEGKFDLPIHYNHIIQAAIYNSIDAELADFLHEKGYVSGQRSFKLFSFSLLRGPYQLNQREKTITFIDEAKLIITSPVEEFCQSMVNILLTRGSIRLGSEELEVEKVFARKQMVEKDEIVVKTLSPVVLYSTLLRPEGGKYTVYFQPGDHDYNRLLRENLRKKYQAFYDSEPPEGKVEARALGQQKMSIIDYKGTIIKGYSGKLLLSGPVPLLQLAVDGGIGGKNSQGFGCLQIERQLRGTCNNLQIGGDDNNT